MADRRAVLGRRRLLYLVQNRAKPRTDRSLWNGRRSMGDVVVARELEKRLLVQSEENHAEKESVACEDPPPVETLAEGGRSVHPESQLILT